MRGGPDFEIRDCGFKSPCWVWLKSCYPSGYGQYTRRDGHRGRAHRAYYELFVGPIPDGLHIDHLCRTRACVTPRHLEPVTPAENIRRGEPATKTHCVQGHPLSGDNLYRDPTGRRQCKTCRREATKRAMDRYTPEQKREMWARYRTTQKAKKARLLGAFSFDSASTTTFGDSSENEVLDGNAG